MDKSASDYKFQWCFIFKILRDHMVWASFVLASVGGDQFTMH